MNEQEMGDDGTTNWEKEEKKKKYQGWYKALLSSSNLE